MELSEDFEILHKDAEVVRVIPNPELKPQIEQAFGMTSLDIRDRKGGLALSGGIQVNDSPVSMAFDVFVRDESGREWFVGRIQFSRADPAISTFASSNFWGYVDGFTADRVDIVLRSSARAARENSDFTEIWGGEIVLEDIEVQWNSEKPEEQGDQ